MGVCLHGRVIRTTSLSQSCVPEVMSRIRAGPTISEYIENTGDIEKTEENEYFQKIEKLNSWIESESTSNFLTSLKS